MHHKISCTIGEPISRLFYTTRLQNVKLDWTEPNPKYYLRKGTLKCVTINLIGRDQEARALIGLEGFRGANQNTECIYDSQSEECILLSANQKA